MSACLQWLRLFGWLVHKDLLREWRTGSTMPAMVLLALAVALVVELQLGGDSDLRLASGAFWLAVLFAATVSLERSFSSEETNGCWQALVACPATPAMLYLAKLATNVLAITLAECVLAPVFVISTGARVSLHPASLLLVLVLGNLALAALGTLLGPVAQQGRRRGTLLSLLLLPSAVPVLLGASAAMACLLQPADGGAWLRWAELLGLCAVMFIVVGLTVFPFLTEDAI